MIKVLGIFESHSYLTMKICNTLGPVGIWIRNSPCLGDVAVPSARTKLRGKLSPQVLPGGIHGCVWTWTSLDAVLLSTKTLDLNGSFKRFYCYRTGRVSAAECELASVVF